MKLEALDTYLTCYDSHFLSIFIRFLSTTNIFSGQNESKPLKMIDNRTPVLRLVRLEQQDPNFSNENSAKLRQKIKKLMSENDNSNLEQIENENESVQDDLKKSIDNVSLNETSKAVQDTPDTEIGI